MKAVLLSIRPKWCELIASGKKTLEIRKTAPKLEPPFKCYIYETKGKVIGEFVCDGIEEFTPTEKGVAFRRFRALYESCLSVAEIREYLGGKVGYGWHIFDPVIYDEPRELQDFIVPSRIGCCNEGKCRGCQYFDRGNGFNIEDDCIAEFSTDEFKPLRRPPQSWCYVEDME